MRRGGGAGAQGEAPQELTHAAVAAHHVAAGLGRLSAGAAAALRRGLDHHRRRVGRACLGLAGAAGAHLAVRVFGHRLHYRRRVLLFLHRVVEFLGFGVFCVHHTDDHRKWASFFCPFSLLVWFANSHRILLSGRVSAISCQRKATTKRL